MRSIGLVALAPIKLDTLLKLKDHTNTIMTRAASVIPYQSTLALSGRTNLPGRWTHRCPVLPWELTLSRISPEYTLLPTPLPTKQPLNSNNIGDGLLSRFFFSCSLQFLNRCMTSGKTKSKDQLSSHVIFHNDSLTTSIICFPLKV